jgi:DnaJ-class molecular chaperone
MTLYETLGLSHHAEQDEIRKAYYQLAKIYHPDSKDSKYADVEKFNEIKFAYEILSNKDKKMQYDKGMKLTDYSYGPLTETFTNNKEKIEDFVTRIRESQRNIIKKNEKKPNLIETYVELTLEESFTGITKIIVLEQNHFKIHFPAGVAHEDKLKVVSQKRNANDEFEQIEILLNVIIQPHQKFKRINNDLFAYISVNVFTALTGGSVETEIFGKKLKINIPPHTQNETVIKLEGYGMPIKDKIFQKGDMYITIKHKLPEKLNQYDLNSIEDYINKYKTSFQN